MGFASVRAFSSWDASFDVEHLVCRMMPLDCPPSPSPSPSLFLSLSLPPACLESLVMACLLIGFLPALPPTSTPFPRCRVHSAPPPASSVAMAAPQVYHMVTEVFAAAVRCMTPGRADPGREEGGGEGEGEWGGRSALKDAAVRVRRAKHGKRGSPI